MKTEPSDNKPVSEVKPVLANGNGEAKPVLVNGNGEAKPAVANGNGNGAEPGIFCTECGAKNNVDANFCKRCGRRTERGLPRKLTEEEFAIPPSVDERVQVLLLGAFRASQAGQVEEAIVACNGVLTIKPDSTDAHSLLSTLYEKRGDIGKAIEARERVLQLNPGSIADREKLDHLKNGESTQPIPRIHTQPRKSTPVLFDTPGGAAVAAVAVFFVVLIGWAAIAHFRNDDNKLVPQNPSNQAAVQVPQQYVSQPGMMGMGQQAPQGYWPYGQQAPNNFNPQNMNQGYQNNPNRNNGPDVSAMRQNPQNSNGIPIPPAPVGFQRVNPMENDPQFSGRPTTPQRDIILPDNGQSGSSGNSGNTGNNGIAPGTNTGLRPDPGKIDIRITDTPAVGKGNGGGTVSVPPTNPGAGSGNSNSQTPSSSQESQSRRASAQALQLQGLYPRAAVEYMKALDGAGDDAASIHQQIALCNQRSDNKDAAIAHYGDAARLFKQMIDAGKNVEAARQGLRSCEAALRALK